jgi:hypothetical protein
VRGDLHHVKRRNVLKTLSERNHIEERTMNRTIMLAFARAELVAHVR